MPDPAVFEAVHVGSLGAALMPGAHRVAELIATADAMGLAVSYDPNVRLAVEPDPAFWREVFETVDPVRADREDERRGRRRAVPRRGTRGPRHAGSPATASSSRSRSVAPARSSRAASSVGGADAPAVAVVDTIGAGDSFMAAMLSWCAAYAWPAADQLDDTELTDLAEFSRRRRRDHLLTAGRRSAAAQRALTGRAPRMRDALGGGLGAGRECLVRVRRLVHTLRNPAQNASPAPVVSTTSLGAAATECSPNVAPSGPRVTTTSPSSSR